MNANLKIEGTQRLQNIENQLEREISGILARKKFTPEYKLYRESTNNKDINAKLKDFLYSAENKVEDSYNDEENDLYENMDELYEEDDDYDYDDGSGEEVEEEHRELSEKHFPSRTNWYERDLSRRHPTRDRDVVNVDNNQNQRESFYRNKSEIRRKKYPDEFVEDLLLEALMPIVANWLDNNIDRITHNVVAKSISKERDRRDRSFVSLPRGNNIENPNSLRKNNRSRRVKKMLIHPSERKGFKIKVRKRI